MKISKPDSSHNKEIMRMLDEHFKNAVILDVETTGLATGNEDLDRNKELTNISVIDAQSGKDIFTSFVKPKHKISDQLSIVNVINNDIVKDAPSFAEIYDKILEATHGKKIIGWNIQFDVNTLIEEAMKLDRDYLDDSQITDIEDGMVLAMKASGLFEYTYHSDMFWKQDEACKLFDSYIDNAGEIEAKAGNTNPLDHQKELNDYIKNEFDEKYHKELYDQLGTKEMHLAYCDNKEYRLTMMKATEMYRNGEKADEDKFIDSLMTQKKKNKYISALNKEHKAEEIINKVKEGENIDDLREEYANKVGGNRSFDNILLMNKDAFEESENNPFRLSGYPKKLIKELYDKGNDVFTISTMSGYDILTVRGNLPRQRRQANNETNDEKEKNKKNKKNEKKEKKNLHQIQKEKIMAKLSRHNSPLSSEIVENLESNERNVIEKYTKLKLEQKTLERHLSAYEDILASKIVEEINPDTKKVYMDDRLKITFNPEEKISKTFNKDAFKFECPDIYERYVLKNEFTKPRETLRFTSFKEVEEPETKMRVTDKFIDNLCYIKEKIEEIKKATKPLEPVVKAVLTHHDCKRIDTEIGRVTYSMSTPQPVLETARLKTEMPEVYDYYTDIKTERNKISTLANPKRKDKIAEDLNEIIDYRQDYNDKEISSR